jgi:hypothetical protein
MPMSDFKISFTQKAAHCRKMAEQAKTPEGRDLWIRMEKFWLDKLSPDTDDALMIVTV